MTDRHTIVKFKQEVRNIAKTDAQMNWKSGTYKYMTFVSRASNVLSSLEGVTDLTYEEQENLIWHYIEAYSQEMCAQVEDKLHGS